MPNQYQVSRKTYEEIVYRFIFGKNFTKIAKELKLSKISVKNTIRKYWYTGYPEEIKMIK